MYPYRKLVARGAARCGLLVLALLLRSGAGFESLVHSVTRPLWANQGSRHVPLGLKNVARRGEQREKVRRRGRKEDL